MAAEVLAHAGHDVVVLEEHAVIGRPVHCTGVLGMEAFHELGLNAGTILSTSTTAAFRHEDGEPVVVDSDRIIAAVVDRAAFDTDLAQRALAAGATLQTEARVDSLSVTAAGVEVLVRGQEVPVRARVCVLACGANYRFNQQLGLGVPKVHVQTAQVEVPFPAQPHIDVRLGREVAPGGFAWLVPFERSGTAHARLGLLCESDAARRFRAFASAHAVAAGVDPSAIPEPRLKMLPLGPVRRTVTDRVLAVGDAAGMVKPTTGGGIYYAMLSGRLAAEVAGDALRRDTLRARDLRPYEDAWRARLGPDIRAGLAFRALATRIGDRGIRALIEVARVDGIVPLLKQHADFNWHRGAALALLRHPAFRRAVVSSFWG